MSISKIRQQISINRLFEVSLMTGFFFIAYLFVPTLDGLQPVTFLLNFGAVYVYILSVYALNSYCDYEIDRENLRLTDLSKNSRQTYLLQVFLFLAGCMLFFFLISTILAGLALFSFALWILYYMPTFRFKSSLLIGTFIHFISGITHFHLCYLAVAPYSTSSISISAFFALLLSMGHLNHELLDFKADKQAGIKNTTIIMGPLFSKALIAALLFIALAWWTLLFFNLIISKLAFGAFLPAIIISLAMSLLYYVGKMSTERFQQIYRLVFFIAGVAVITGKLFRE